jgi:hypothetical protein
MTDVAFWLLVHTGGAGWSRLVAFDCAPLGLSKIALGETLLFLFLHDAEKIRMNYF